VYKIAFMTSHFAKNALSYQESGDGTNNAIWHYMGQELIKPLTSDQMRAARALLRWSAEDLAQRSSVSLRTIRRAELAELHTTLTTANNLAIRRALESAGIEFIDENGGGPGVRRRKGLQKKR
jgi:ribosome-binding protein aMBF1 (putative translation factor)